MVPARFCCQRWRVFSISCPERSGRWTTELPPCPAPRTGPCLELIVVMTFTSPLPADVEASSDVILGIPGPNRDDPIRPPPPCGRRVVRVRERLACSRAGRHDRRRTRVSSTAVLDQIITTSNPTVRAVAATTAVLLTCIIALSFPSRAHAGVYTIHNCPDSLQPNNDTGSWRAYATSAGAGGVSRIMHSGRDCGSGDRLVRN